tara:strand:- start:1196 stop:1762 length:567 start_codon:yes stop_codon:yes gene_type:complete
MGHLIVICAPSGAGKTSVVKYLLSKNKKFVFSVSACSRKKRPYEEDGVDYHFISPEIFRKKIENNEFLEWEEVYPNQFYGTLKRYVDENICKNKNMIFDIDVVGGLNIKNIYKNKCLSIFIAPPSIAELKNRLEKRGTESIENINTRIKYAKQEMLKKREFDVVVLNKNFSDCCAKVEKIITNFICKQ